jgi:hypothetical protein
MIYRGATFGQQHICFVDVNGHLQDAWWDSNGWYHQRL